MQVNKGSRFMFGIYTNTILCKVIQLEDILSYNFQLKIKNIPHITEVILISNLFPFSYVLLVSLYPHSWFCHSFSSFRDFWIILSHRFIHTSGFYSSWWWVVYDKFLVLQFLWNEVKEGHYVSRCSDDADTSKTLHETCHLILKPVHPSLRHWKEGKQKKLPSLSLH